MYIGFIPCHVPVSYTHLDVYKRQNQDRQSSLLLSKHIFQWWQLRQGVIFTPISFISTFAVVAVGVVASNLISVSYTHLDVVQLVRASDCGSECRRFESGLPPPTIKMCIRDSYLDYEIELNSFAVEYYPNGRPSRFAANVRLWNEKALLEVNHPYAYRLGEDIYLTGYDEMCIRDRTYTT